LYDRLGLTQGISPVSHLEPAIVVEVAPLPFVAVTIGTSDFPTSDADTVYVVVIAPGPVALEHALVAGG
jgi:hypothetical protein